MSLLTNTTVTSASKACTRPCWLAANSASITSANQLTISNASLRRMSTTKDQVRCCHHKLMAMLCMRPLEAPLCTTKRLRQRRRSNYLRSLHHPGSVSTDDHADASTTASGGPRHVYSDVQLYREPRWLPYHSLRPLPSPARHTLHNCRTPRHARPELVRTAEQLPGAFAQPARTSRRLSRVLHYRFLSAARFV